MAHALTSRIGVDGPEYTIGMGAETGFQRGILHDIKFPIFPIFVLPLREKGLF